MELPWQPHHLGAAEMLTLVMVWRAAPRPHRVGGLRACVAGDIGVSVQAGSDRTQSVPGPDELPMVVRSAAFQGEQAVPCRAGL